MYALERSNDALDARQCVTPDRIPFAIASRSIVPLERERDVGTNDRSRERAREGDRGDVTSGEHGRAIDLRARRRRGRRSGSPRGRCGRGRARGGGHRVEGERRAVRRARGEREDAGETTRGRHFEGFVLGANVHGVADGETDDWSSRARL